eukprot:CAMPEP_0179413312 /NCGR_PEP_ID=MMETSP0799-20121207/5024_1 /TAXON_ID=46947 /ORGANISM="Geminigera cryophila, Strain CCMP2564" /LENGTH=254 /DNA_ID=CAMNT_0021185761 /DNA_START=76 /DNA_END=840 /DNA_ORIENTATION=+
MGSMKVLNTKEKEDISEQLPQNWTKATDLGKVALYQMPVSPPCCKLRMIFEYYKVDYQCYKGKKKGSDYKKVPAIVVANLQINDSFVIVKALAKILDGAPLSPALLELEEMTTFGTMVALEAQVANNTAELNKCGPMFGTGISPIIGAILPCVSCCLTTCAGPGFYKKNPHLLSLQEYQDKYAAALQNKQFFHGSAPGIVDVSFCGMIAPFEHAGNKCVSELIGAKGPLAEWYARMKLQVPTLSYDAKSIELSQ